MRKLVAILFLLAGISGILIPSAFAARSAPVSERRVLAQETSPPECVIGEVCDTETGDLTGPTVDRKDVPDPAGSWLRSVIMFGLLTIGFVLYLRWALVKGAKVG